MSQDLDLPSYPVYRASLVVESNFLQRQGLLQELRATRLFEVVIDAKSLRHGVEVLRNNAVDICVVGPTVEPAHASTFLTCAKHFSRNKDCAYLKMLPEKAEGETDAASALPFDALPVDGIVPRGLTKRKLSDSLVRAVRQANERVEQLKAKYASGQVLKLSYGVERISEKLRILASQLASSPELRGKALQICIEEELRSILYLGLNEVSKEVQQEAALESVAKEISRWCVERLCLEESNARDELRRRLLKKAQGSQQASAPQKLQGALHKAEN